MIFRYRIITNGDTYIAQHRPAWWPFWSNDRTFYTEKKAREWLYFRLDQERIRSLPWRELQ